MFLIIVINNLRDNIRWLYGIIRIFVYLEFIVFKKIVSEENV